MPTEHGIRLDDVEGLPPGAQLGGQKDEESPVAPGELRSLCVPVEDDQLLAKYSVLEHQVRLAAGQVKGGVEDRGIVVGFRPVAKKVSDGLEDATNALSHEGEECRDHSLPLMSEYGG